VSSIVSDGGSATIPDLVAREMAKLARAAYAVRLGQPTEGQSRVPAARRRNARGPAVR
jgi:hypothetical protein